MKRILLAIYGLIISTLVFSQANIDKGLIAYYTFSGNFNDQSSNHLNGKGKKVSFTSDRNGITDAAGYFNGSSFVQLPFSELYNFSNKAAYTISAWIMPEAGGDAAQAIVVKSPYSDNYTRAQWNYGLYTVGNKTMMGFADHHILQSNSTLKNNTWYNLTTTYSNGIWKLYVNCVLEKEDMTRKNFILKDGYSSISLGKKGEANGDWFKGKMDDVRIYNRALSDDEIIMLCEKKNPQISTEPVIDFTYKVNSCNIADFSISQKENIKSIKWDLGDNTIEHKASFAHIYQPGKIYTVKLFATGTNDKEIIITKTVNILKPLASFTFETVKNKYEVVFNAAEKENVKYNWIFGDGGISDKQNTIHTYKTFGNYSAKLITENKTGCSDTAVQLVSMPDTNAAKPSSPKVTAPLVKTRKNTLLKQIEIVSDTVSVSFYDNAEIDGDSVTIVFNDKIIATHLFLTDKEKNFKLAIDRTLKTNELIMYAENLGSIPPNTALMVVYDGKIRHEIAVRSTKTTNGTISFIFKK